MKYVFTEHSNGVNRGTRRVPNVKLYGYRVRGPPGGHPLEDFVWNPKQGAIS